MTAVTHTPIRLLCVDDHHVVRNGLVLIMNRQPGLKVVATASTGEQAIVLHRDLLPDVTVMDLQLPKMAGLAAVRAIRSETPDARIIILTVCNDENDMYQANEAGAAAYLVKDALPDDLIRTIRQVHDGERPLAAAMRLRRSERTERSKLTPRELEVIRLMAQAMRNKEIATVLGLSEQTVHAHIKNIFLKLQVADRIAAINLARRYGLISAH
jgi:two-component system NarL family response regulator